MKIAIDGVKLSGKPCGLTNIALSIITGLANIGKHEIVVLMKAEPHPEILKDLRKLRNVEVLVSPPPILKTVSIFWSIFCINKLVKQTQASLFIAPNFLISPWRYNKKIKTVVFVHDLVIKEYPETMHWFNRLHMFLTFRYSLKKTNVIWCNTHYTADRLKHFYKNSIINKKIFIGSGIQKNDTNESLQDVNFIHTLTHFKPYILFVGTIEPRKNAKFLIELYGELYKRFNLLMVGGKGWGTAAQEIDDLLMKQPHLNERILRVSNIYKSDLNACYSNAEFYISTSFNEGLGLPVLEAMHLCCPVVTPLNSAFIEIVKDVEVTVSGWNIDDWIEGINKLLSNKEEYIKKGTDQVKKYDWDSIISSFVEYIS
jgi:glycosyltransferase involved in cell wall biosynthesis